jgi:hypothetical protein
MCDASATVPLSRDRFVVADDEDNVLRVYDAVHGGAPLARSDLSAELGLERPGKKRAAEADLEAATRVGERAYFISSHGRDKKGRERPERLRFFATTITEDGAGLHLIGHAYEHLLADLVATPALAALGLGDAAQRAPKQDAGLNLEGLTASPDGTLLLGFRSPVPDGQALVVSILNPAALVDAPGGGPAAFGPPVRLDLGGRGVRSLSWWRGRYLVIGGAIAEGGDSKLYTWSGTPGDAPREVADLAGYNPEGFFSPEERDDILVVSDDGTRVIDGLPCKDLPDPAKKQFRAVWISLPPASSPSR